MKNKRHIKLINPGVQLGLGARFLGLAILTILFQALVMNWLIIDSAVSMPEGGAYLVDLAPTLLLKAIGLSLVLVLPTTLIVGVLSSFSLVGPLYRFEEYLKSLLAGEQVDACRIRSKDKLHGLCGLLNQATEPLRAQNSQENARAGQEPNDSSSTTRVSA